MRPEAAIDRVKRELHRVLDNMRADLERVEILTAALKSFSKPVPDYEPGFRHKHQMMLNAHQLGP